jgi:hypothetical protein
MFVFDNALDKDARSYGYELYEANQVSGSYPNINPITSATIYSSGTSGANVFTVAVENSTDSTTTRYYGRIRTIDSSGNPSEWSPIVQSDQANPLISNQYISSITAAKITAGTIGAHEIVLTQAGSPTSYTAPANTAVIRSSNYQANTAGWLIRGDGYAEFDSTTIRGGLKAGSVFINSDNRWKSDANGNLIVNPEFKVGSSTKYLSYDGANTITFTGNLVAAGGTFSGNLSAAGGSFSGQLDVGSGNTSFHVDTSGNMWLGNASYASAPFKVSNAGVVTATSGTFSGAIDVGTGSNSFHVNTSGQIWSGNAAYASAPFRVNNDGTLYAASGTIAGSMILSSSGTLTTGAGLGATTLGYNASWSGGRSGVFSDGYGLGFASFSYGDISVYTSTYGSAPYSQMTAAETFSRIINTRTLTGWGQNYIAVTGALSGFQWPDMGFGPNDPSFVSAFYATGNPAANAGFSATATRISDGYQYSYNAFLTTSDRRVKINIEEVSEDWEDKFLNQIKIYQFDKINFADDDDLHAYGKHLGVMADEFKELFPQWESSYMLKDPNGTDANMIRAVDYQAMIPGLIWIAQKFNRRIKELETRLAALE